MWTCVQGMCTYMYVYTYCIYMYTLLYTGWILAVKEIIITLQFYCYRTHHYMNILAAQKWHEFHKNKENTHPLIKTVFPSFVCLPSLPPLSSLLFTYWEVERWNLVSVVCLFGPVLDRRLEQVLRMIAWWCNPPPTFSCLCPALMSRHSVKHNNDIITKKYLLLLLPSVFHMGSKPHVQVGLISFY